ncbi:MAG: prolyl oligopeptidase family serine peptidase, partial [Mycobacterium sp.]
HGLMLPFLEQFVMQKRHADDPALFESASPISHAHREAPPFFVLHGENDSLVPRAQAQTFCAALREAGAATVCYAELPNAHHAFDIVGTVRSRLAADAVADFFGAIYGRYLRSRQRVLRKRATPAS